MYLQCTSFPNTAYPSFTNTLHQRVAFVTTDSCLEALKAPCSFVCNSILLLFFEREYCYAAPSVFEFTMLHQVGTELGPSRSASRIAGLVVVPHPTPGCPRFSVEYKPEWLDSKARPPPEDQQSQQVHALAAI